MHSKCRHTEPVKCTQIIVSVSVDIKVKYTVALLCNQASNLMRSLCNENSTFFRQFSKTIIIAQYTISVTSASFVFYSNQNVKQNGFLVDITYN